MNLTNTSVIISTLVFLSFSSCQQIALDNEEDTTEEIVIPKGQSRLALNLTADANEATISWPVSIYVFNSDNTCADTKTLTASTTSTDFTLPAGTYSLYAVGGMSSDSYNLPTKENATSTTALSLQDGVNEHADIMMAQQSGITLTANTSSTQTLNFARKVAKITSVSITDVPEDVTEVTITLSPVFTSVKLDGTFTDTYASSWSYKLTKDNTTQTTWKANCNAYILPNNEEMSIKYQFKTNTATREYTQTTSQITANHKISIEANYKKEILTATMTCALNGAAWDNDVNITSVVDEVKMTKVEDNSTPDDNTDSGTEPVADIDAVEGAAVPEVGENVNTPNTKVHVIKKQTYGNYTYVTLMYQSEETQISKSKLTEQDAIKTAVETRLTTLNKKKTYDVKKWRLPTLSELKYIYTHYDELCTAIGNDYFIRKFSDSYIYYCTDTNGDIIGYTFYSDNIVPLKTSSTTNYINGFVVMRYNK